MTLTRSMIQVMPANAETPPIIAPKIKNDELITHRKLECQRITNGDSFFMNTKWRK